LVLLVVLAGAVFFYFRPVQPGDLAALAQNWSVPGRAPASALDTSDDDFNRWGPHQPTATGRPASWPADPSRASPRGADGAPMPRQIDPQDPPRGYEYPDTGLPPVGVMANPPREGGRMENASYDVMSDPFGDRVADPSRASPRPSPLASRPVAPAPDPGTPCAGAEIVARIGNDVILAREVSLGIPEIRAANKDRVPASVLEQGIRENMKKQLDKRLEDKLVCLDAQRTIPKEQFTKIMGSFEKEYEMHVLPELMKQNKVGSQREWEQKLRDAGITLEIQKRAYIEAVLAREWMKKEVNVNEEMSADQIEAYYREHAAEFVVHPPLSRWEQLMVRTSRFPSREAAYAALAEMGNQVLDGSPLADVAKARSQGSTAAQGGAWDWTGKGHLASKILDEAIFTLPIGRLSPILEDEQGFHIVRVLQRQPQAMKPFAEAQVEIRKKIKARRQSEAKAAYLAKLREQTAVWTAFDNDRGSAAARLDGLFR
jgi:parvulin-like peptidyl-prolyl isomerase